MSDEELLNFLASNLEEAGFLPFAGVEAEEIMEIEGKLGFELPDFFRLFYLHFNGAKNEEGEICYPLVEALNLVKELNISGYFPFFKNALDQLFMINQEGKVYCLDEAELEFLGENFSDWIVSYWE